MKTSKRITSLIVALVFALTSVVSFTVLADDPDFSDVPQTHSYYSAVSNLVAKGVINGYEDGTFKPEATITRAEFAKLLAVATAPVEMKFEATTTQFPDVADANSSSAWAIPYIAYAVGIKAINGYEDGTFRPTAPVSYGEAIKMIVCTMGYGDVVDKTLDPWFMGYVNVANSIGLTKGAYLNGSQPAPRGVVAQLIYNIDFCSKLNNVGFDENKDPIFIQGGGSGGGGGQDWDNSETNTGKLLGVFEYSLTGKALTKTEVLIGSNVYDIGKYDVETLKEMVGYTVSFDYTTMGRNTLTSVIKESNANRKITIEDWQIEEVNADHIMYYEDEDAKDTMESSKLKFSDKMYVVVNGVPVHPDFVDDDIIEEYLNVESGNITFISNDGSSSSVEVAIVESYVTYFVSSVIKEDNDVTIYDKYPQITGLEKYDFDAHDTESVKRISTKGGSYSDSTIDSIAQKNVVSIAKPYGTTEGTGAIISTVTVTGSVKEMSSDYEYVKIGSEDYKASPYFKKLLNADVADLSFSTGDSGKFYLDYQGRIVFFEKTADSGNPYGILIRYKHGSGMDAAYSVEIYTENGKLIQHPLKDNIKLNGKSSSPAVVISNLENTTSLGANWDYKEKTGEKDEDGNDILEKVDLDGYLVQPIRYNTTVDGGVTKISEIECMDSADFAKGTIVPAYPSASDYEDGVKGEKLTYSKSGYSFKEDGTNRFAMSTKTVVFVVPDDIRKSDSYKKYGYTYSFIDGREYNVEAYNVDKGNAEVVIYYPETSNTGATIAASTSVYLINSVTPANFEESPATKVTYYKAGSTVLETKYIEDDYKKDDYAYDPADLKSGDMVKMTISGNYITNIKAVYVDGELKPDTGKDGKFEVEGHYIKADNSGTTDYYQVILGVVYELNVDEKSLKVVPAFMEDNDAFNAEAWERRTLSDSVAYYKYNTKDNKYVETVSDEILSYVDLDESVVGESTKVLAIVRENKVVAITIVE